MAQLHSVRCCLVGRPLLYCPQLRWYIMWKVQCIIPWSISVLAHYIPFTFLSVPISSNLTSHILLQYSGITAYFFLPVSDSVPLPLVLMSWEHYFCRSCSLHATYYHVDDNEIRLMETESIVQSSSIATICG